MKQFSCSCTVHEGRLKIYDLDMFRQGMKVFGDGEELELHIEEAGRKRTHAQNRFFHGPILAAFMTLGHHKQEAKDMLALEFLPREVKALDGTLYRVPGHTSELTVEEFNDLIEACLQLADELSLHIPDSQEWRRQHRGAA